MKRILILVLFLICLSAQAWAETKKISGTTNVEDALIYQEASDVNEGSRVYLETFTSAGSYHKTFIRVKNIASELGAGATDITAVCSLYCFANYVDDKIYAYRVFKPWIEGTGVWTHCTGTNGGVTWDDWNCLDLEWGTAGCANASDAGSDNSGDGTDYDRKATAESYADVTTINTWYSWNISTELATGWYDGTIGERGIILVGSIVTGDNRFYSTEYTDDPTKCPFWTFTYTVEEEEEGAMRVKDDWRFTTHFMRDWRFQDVEEWGITPMLVNGEILKRLENGEVAHVLGRQYRIEQYQWKQR